MGKHPEREHELAQLYDAESMNGIEWKEDAEVGLMLLDSQGWIPTIARKIWPL